MLTDKILNFVRFVAEICEHFDADQQNSNLFHLLIGEVHTFFFHDRCPDARNFLSTFEMHTNFATN